jgi:hypothetical protein
MWAYLPNLQSELKPSVVSAQASDPSFDVTSVGVFECSPSGAWTGMSTYYTF